MSFALIMTARELNASLGDCTAHPYHHIIGEQTKEKCSSQGNKLLVPLHQIIIKKKVILQACYLLSAGFYSIKDPVLQTCGNLISVITSGYSTYWMHQVTFPTYVLALYL